MFRSLTTYSAANNVAPTRIIIVLHHTRRGAFTKQPRLMPEVQLQRPAIFHTAHVGDTQGKRILVCILQLWTREYSISGTGMHSGDNLRRTSKVKMKSLCSASHTSADNVTLLAFAAERRPCSNRSISPGRLAQSSKPAAAACGSRMTGQTDRRTDGRSTVS